MRFLKIIKYSIAFVLFVILTSFKPADKFANIQMSGSQVELPIINE